MNTVIRKHALKNALEHGEAILKAVMPKVIGEFPEAKEDIKSLIAKINKVIKEVNLLSRTEVLAQLTSLAPELLEKKEEVKGLKELPNVKDKVVMRFAPFPSGALHIGNTRAVIINDEYTKKYNGELVLFFDDTIGSEAKPISEYAYKGIPEMLNWLGCKVSAVHYKSDRLKQYYDYAERMINKGIAYVCECPSELIRDYREKGIECSHRKQSINDNLTKWKSMFKNYKEGDAALRLKTDMKHKNPSFRDRVIMRISDRKHPRVGNKYRVWPMLELSWAVDDLWLGITHIYRGNDLYIEDLMERFIWKEMGEEYSPEILHWGLLSIEGIKISKSKAKQEVDSGEYTGWDDPRTWSLESLRRRGILPEALREFVLELGVSHNDIKVPIDKLYTINRRLIDPVSMRYFFVKDPVKLVVNDCPEMKIEIPMHHSIKKTRTYIIEKGINEFMISVDDAELLKKEKKIRLKDAMNIELVSAGKTMKAKYAKDQKEVYDIKKVQFVIKGMNCEVLRDDGSIDNGLCESYCSKIKNGESIQFERYGFCKKESEGKYIYTHN